MNDIEKKRYVKNINFILKLILIIFIISLRFFKNNLSKIKNIKINKNDYEMFLYKKDKKRKFNNKTLLYICMALDDNVVFPTLTSMTSALENNNNEKNILVYNLLLSHDFNKENIKIYESLKRNYPVIINYYIIPNIFDSFKKWKHKTYCHYYKLLIPILFPDTLIFRDLSKLFYLDFKHYFIFGSQATNKYIIKKFNIKINVYINVGVLLFNIKKIRKSNKDIELLYFTMKNSNKFKYPEQDSLNLIFNPNIGLLPYEYGMRIIDSLDTYRKHCEPEYIKKYSIKEIKNALLKPAIINLTYCIPKVWNRKTKSIFKNDTICKKYQKDFYFYAKKTNYFSEIIKKLYI